MTTPEPKYKKQDKKDVNPIVTQRELLLHLVIDPFIAVAVISNSRCGY